MTNPYEPPIWAEVVETPITTKKVRPRFPAISLALFFIVSILLLFSVASRAMPAHNYLVLFAIAAFFFVWFCWRFVLLLKS